VRERAREDEGNFLENSYASVAHRRRVNAAWRSIKDTADNRASVETIASSNPRATTTVDEDDDD
jgi:hypothetical protein